MSKKEIARRVIRLTKKAREMERKGKDAERLWDEIDSLNERLTIMIENEMYSKMEMVGA